MNREMLDDPRPPSPLPPVQPIRFLEDPDEPPAMPLGRVGRVLFAVVFIALNMLIDMLYMLVNPRIRHD